MTKLSSTALTAAASTVILVAAMAAATPALAQDAPSGPEAAAPGLDRPQLKHPPLKVPPRLFFCSEREKLDFLLDHFYGPAKQATEENIAAHNYLVKVRQLRDASSGGLRDAYQTELDAWTPEWRQAEQLASAFLKMLDVIKAMPVIDCRAVKVAEINFRVDARPDPKAAAKLEAARASKPQHQVGLGGYADFGLRGARPFDGSEAENPLRDRLKLAAEYRHRRDDDDHRPVTGWTPGITYPPRDPGMTAIDPPPQPSWTGTVTWPPYDTGMTSLEPPLPTPVDIDLGDDTLTGPSYDSLPPPRVERDFGMSGGSAPGGGSPPDPLDFHSEFGGVYVPGVAYPPCPTDGMPATPEHIRDFHS